MLLNKFLKRLLIVLGVLVALLVPFAAGQGIGKRLDDFGGEGQSCYPNKTCDAPNTCFAIRKEYVCERQVTPALILTADSCFVFQDEQGTHQSCHKSLSECTLHFAATVETKVNIIKGCSK